MSPPLTAGTEKYPDVGHYHQFIGNNGGSSNAWTSPTDTLYYFNIGNSSFKEGLDIFSQFFIAPLLLPTYVQKEMNAVDSEFQKNVQNDLWRAQHLFRVTSNPESPLNMFSTGNLKSLDVPDIYDRLKTFYDTHYRWPF